jgi:hypothetical protein
VTVFSRQQARPAWAADGIRHPLAAAGRPFCARIVRPQTMNNAGIKRKYPFILFYQTPLLFGQYLPVSYLASSSIFE